MPDNLINESAGYDALLADIKERVRTARVRASLAVNWELVLLHDTARPIGVSEYELTAAPPDDFKGSLPTAEEIEAALAGAL